MLKIKEHKSTTQLIDEGIWKAGPDRFIKVEDIDEEYLQDIFFTLQSRELRLRKRYVYDLHILDRLYGMIIKRAEELDIRLKCNFIPLQDLPNAPELEDVDKYYQERVQSSTNKS